VRMAKHSQPSIQLLAAPVPKYELAKRKPRYFSEMVVHKDSPFDSFASLRGSNWCFNDMNSLSGRLIVLQQLKKIGESTSYFKTCINSGGHLNSIELIKNGTADTAAIDCQVLSILREQFPERIAHLRVVDTLGPYSIQPVVVASYLPAEIKEMLLQAFISMGSDEDFKKHMDIAQFHEFVRMEDSDYDDIRNLLLEHC